MEKIIIIVGPTAVGKTSLSVKLAKELQGEIISGDSMQVYKEMSIGTAKVKEEEKEGNTDISIACFSFLSTHFQQDSDDIYKADNLIIRKPEQESTSEVILGKRKTPALFQRRCLKAVL